MALGESEYGLTPSFICKTKKVTSLSSSIAKTGKRSASLSASAHQVEFYFKCKLATDFNPHSIPTNPDSYQIRMEWVHIKDLCNIPSIQ